MWTRCRPGAKSPNAAASHFIKIECFCFTETKVEPGEKLDMPVVFYLDPEMVDSEEVADVNTVTLSYTFFASEPDQDTLTSNTIEKSAGSAGG